MQIAISGTELDEFESISELIHCAQELEISFVELWYPRNTAKAGLDQTLTLIAEAELQIACVATGSELYRKGGSLEDQALLMEAIELAQRVGAPYVNTYFGYNDVQDDATAIAIYKTYLEPCLELAIDRGVIIVLENEFNAFGVDNAASDITRRPLSLRRLFEEVSSPAFRLNFDACNFYCAGVEPYPYAYELLRPFIAYCHLKDGCRYDTHLAAINPMLGWKLYTDFDNQYITRPMGEGAIPWTNLLSRLGTDGYDGFLMLEPHSEAHLRREAWHQATAFVRQVWPQD